MKNLDKWINAFNMAIKIADWDRKKILAKISGPETLSLQGKHTVVELKYHLYSYRYQYGEDNPVFN
jgi:hypothetical protein